MKGALLFCGFYGCGNLGDDALLLSLLSFAAETRPRAPLAYLSGGDASLGALLRGRGIEAVAVPRMRPAALRAVRDADTVVLGGGSILQSATGRASLFYYLSLLSLAQRLGKRTALLAGGIGPIAHPLDRKITAAILRRLSYASFRDEAARNEGRVLGAPEPYLSADPALLLKGTVEYPHLYGRFTLVSLREKTGISPEDAARKVAEHTVGRDELPVFADLFPREDAAYTDRVASLVGVILGRAPIRLPPFRDPEALISAVRHSSSVIAGRYHLALFAMQAGKETTVLGSDPKLSAIRSETRSPKVLEHASETDLLRFFSRFP